MSQLVTPTNGVAVVPFPLPPTHVTDPVGVATQLKLENRFPELTAPPAVVTVSRKSSLLFRIVYVHVYGSKIFVVALQPFEPPIPCSPCAPAPAVKNTA